MYRIRLEATRWCIYLSISSYHSLIYGSYSVLPQHVPKYMAHKYLNEVKNENCYLKHFSHKHPLVLIQNNDDNDTPGVESISLHNPIKRIKLLCDGCVRPIIYSNALLQVFTGVFQLCSP